MYACARGDEAMVQMLLDAGADINSEVSDSEIYEVLIPQRHRILNLIGQKVLMNFL